MKLKLALAAMPILILGACAEEAEVVEEEAMEQEVAVPTATDGGPIDGTFEVTTAEGEVATYVMDGAGGFTVSAGEETGSGTIEITDEGTCIDYADDEEDAVCYVQGDLAQDGSWTSTSPEGGVSTVRRVLEEAAAE